MHWSNRHANFFASQIVVPGSGVGKTRDHIDAFCCKVPENNGILSGGVEVNPLSLICHINIEIPGREHGLRGLQLGECTDVLDQCSALRNFQVFPQSRFFIQFARLVKRSISAIEKVQIVTQLALLPHHFGTWSAQKKGMCKSDSLHGSLKFLNIVAVVARPVCLHFMGKPLLVMAFEIGQEVRPIPTTVAPYTPVEVAP